MGAYGPTGPKDRGGDTLHETDTRVTAPNGWDIRQCATALCPIAPDIHTGGDIYFQGLVYRGTKNPMTYESGAAMIAHLIKKHAAHRFRMALIRELQDG